MNFLQKQNITGENDIFEFKILVLQKKLIENPHEFTANKIFEAELNFNFVDIGLNDTQQIILPISQVLKIGVSEKWPEYLPDDYREFFKTEFSFLIIF